MTSHLENLFSSAHLHDEYFFVASFVEIPTLSKET